MVGSLPATAAVTFHQWGPKAPVFLAPLVSPVEVPAVAVGTPLVMGKVAVAAGLLLDMGVVAVGNPLVAGGLIHSTFSLVRFSLILSTEVERTEASWFGSVLPGLAAQQG